MVPSPNEQTSHPPRSHHRIDLHLLNGPPDPPQSFTMADMAVADMAVADMAEEYKYHPQLQYHNPELPSLPPALPAFKAEDEEEFQHEVEMGGVEGVDGGGGGVEAEGERPPEEAALDAHIIPRVEEMDPIVAAGMTAEEIGEAALVAASAAPLEIRPRKKRKKNEEFTVAKKLSILEELDGPHAKTVQALAAMHGTTKTSIYRWKKDRRRLVKLVRKEGKGDSKRASLKRKMNNEEFTAAEKLEILKELDAPDVTVKRMSDKHGANKRSIYRWRKDRARLAKLVEEDGKGECKRVGLDPLERIKAAVKAFHDQNSLLAPNERLNFTGAIIAAKAKQSKKHFLAEHAVRPFLSDLEVRSLNEFTASESWGRKISQRFGWSNANKKKRASAGGEGGLAFAAAPRSASAKPGRPKKSTTGTKGQAAQQHLRAEISIMRTDMTELRERTEGAEDRELRLANENEELRREIAWLKMRQT